MRGLSTASIEMVSLVFNSDSLTRNVYLVCDSIDLITDAYVPFSIRNVTLPVCAHETPKAETRAQNVNSSFLHMILVVF